MTTMTEVMATMEVMAWWVSEFNNGKWIRGGVVGGERGTELEG